MTPADISLIALILDIGIDRVIDVIKLCQKAGVDLPTLEEIKAEVEKWQPKADLIAAKIDAH